MAFSSPADILATFGIHEGQAVADLGAGSGFYTFAAAKMVGPAGKVYALEVQSEVLDRLANQARKEKLTNISFLHSDIERHGGTKIADHVVDVAFVCNVLFQIEEKAAFIQEVKRILKPGGRVLAVDWAGSFAGTGPQKQYVVTEVAGRELFKTAGFTEIGPIAAGDHHWGFTFRK